MQPTTPQSAIDGVAADSRSKQLPARDTAVLFYCELVYHVIGHRIRPLFS
jgi:hypothetical protein